ncbi:hypothetical protein AKJ51_02650 [candidate division MSBL1 archaeon SCGC-AAA382A20]|uniref:UspA domain-containing protein n=1 Tax=candidate division MSBL1 archaeon SCGC-AAA382A20 TaxID=1698280 RepID=A0A133VKB6_9EURY|nr:hypothetical protein AKJ51_02650 [candidate division MSBL1 archaeon SCGC-AAA382A20]
MKKVEKVLIPYFGENLPEKAEERALEKLEKGGKLFLLHIVDEAPTRSLRYRTGQIGEDSQIIKTVRETMKKVQEKKARKYAEEVKSRAAQKGISVEPLFTSGSPGEETIKAIEEHSIQLVIAENLRNRVTEIFAGDEIDYICNNAPCEVETVST